MKMEQLLKYGIVIPTKEFNGGMLGGVGLGVMIATVILSPEHRITVPWVYFLAFGCIAIGSALARAAQRKRFQQKSGDGKRMA